jgi:hypothetical protein
MTDDERLFAVTAIRLMLVLCAVSFAAIAVAQCVGWQSAISTWWLVLCPSVGAAQVQYITWRIANDPR